MRVVSSVDRVDRQSLGDGDALVCAPSFSIPTRPCHHALNGHARIERSWRKVGTGGGMNTGIEQAAECHAVLHQRLAVKMEFIRVVIGVSREQSRNSVYHFYAADKIV